VNRGTIFTFDQETEIIMEGIYIQIRPVWKWLIGLIDKL